MFYVVTGLDGSGTSTIANKLSESIEDSYLLKTPSQEFGNREIIDTEVRKTSPTANMLYYLSSTVYISDYIKKHCDYKNRDVILVRYLIDTVVSNRVAGIPIDFDYNIYGNQLLVPDRHIFVYIDEEIRQKRITTRGKSELDKVLDDNHKRIEFLKEFKKLLPSDTVYVNNNSQDTATSVKHLVRELKQKH